MGTVAGKNFLLEFVRLDSPAIGRVTIAQIVALCVIAAFTAFMVWRVKAYKASQGAQTAVEPELGGE